LSAVRRVGSVLRRGANVFMFARAAPFYARYTIRYHLPAELLLGMFAGIIQLSDLVSRKTLGAPDWVITLQTSAPMMTFVLAMAWRDLLEDRDRRKTLILTGLFGKGIFLLAAFVVAPIPLLVVVVTWALVDSAFIPIRNSIFRANYDDRVRGRFFGGVVSLTNLALVVANLGAAYLLSHWEMSYRILLPVAAVVGIAAHVIYSRVRLRGEDRQPVRDRPVERFNPFRPFVRGFRTTVRILREDPAFRAYERNFFIYGMAFLMNLPLVVFLIVDEIQLPYHEAGWARFAIPHMMLILLSPFAGLLLDRSHPTKLMAVGCVLLAAHSGLLFLAHGFWTLAASYACFGMAMTAVNLAWNLGPMQFAKSEKDAADYMAVHVTLTGVRAMLGPILALTAIRVFGLRGGFIVSGGLYVLAALLMVRLSRRYRGRTSAG